MDGWGIKDLHKCGEEMSKNSSLPSREQQETSELNGSGGGRDKGAKAFCPGWRHQPGQKATRAFCPGLIHQPGQKGVLLSRLVDPTGTKDPCPSAGPASRWTRDKNHLLSRIQRLPGQMTWKKGLFCSSDTYTSSEIHN